MLDIDDLLDYAQDDCVFDVYDCDKGVNIVEGCDKEYLENWHETHAYDLCSFEPIQRQETGFSGNQTIFGIVFNVSKVEDNGDE